MEKFFITGVDTDIGKTYVSAYLCLKYKKEGKTVGYFKPFQSGAIKKEDELIAPDVYELQKKGIESKYSYLLEGEVSPYLASIKAGVNFDIKKVKKDIEEFSLNKDAVIIEGAGGLLCPIKEKYTFLDFIKEINSKDDIKTIIVTTPDLGRINHTLMTIQCAKNENMEIEGIIINKMPKNPTESQKSFMDELKAFCDTKIIDVIFKENV